MAWHYIRRREPPLAYSKGWRWMPLGAVAIAVVAGYALGLHRYLSLESAARYHTDITAFVDAHPALARAAYVAIYVGAVSLSFPGASALTAAGGFIFGWVVGGALAAVSATVGATIIFLIARTSAGDFLASRAGPRLHRLSEGFAAEAFNWLLFLRLAPVFPFWIVNLAAALFGMRLGPFVLATAIGILPATGILAYLGEQLDGSLDGKGPVLSFGLIASLFLLALISLLPVALRHFQSRDTPKTGIAGGK